MLQYVLEMSKLDTRHPHLFEGKNIRFTFAFVPPVCKQQLSSFKHNTAAVAFALIMSEA